MSSKMDELREGKTTTTDKDNPNTTVNTNDTNNKDTKSDATRNDNEAKETFYQTTAANSLENWNALSYWYNMQCYYQHYYASCYMYTCYYWQLLASQNNQNGFSTLTQTSDSSSQQNRQVGQAQRSGFVGCEARISSIQKRIIAELLDFFFLYFTKFLMFSIFYNSVERYSQLQYSLIIDENTNLKDLEEILIQALVYRFMVFAYETFFIVGGFYGELGGATPGKHLVGISVLAAEYVEVVDNDIVEGQKVKVFPGSNPGWWRASLRALVKNFSMTFLFPVFLTIFFFNHNQTIYDAVAGTVVVEKKSQRPIQQ